MAEQGLPHLTLHGLRHSFASAANELHIPMFKISKALGHSNTSVTSQVYTHLFDDTQNEVLSQVANAIECGGKGEQMSLFYSIPEPNAFNCSSSETYDSVEKPGWKPASTNAALI